MSLNPRQNLFQYITQNALKKVMVTAVFSIGSGIGTSVLIGLIQRQLHQPNPHIGMWGALYFGILILQFVFMAVGTHFSSLLSQHIVYDLRKKLVSQFLKNPFQKIENSRDEFFSVLTNDIQILSDGIKQVPGFLVALGILTGCMTYLLFVAWKMVIFTLVILCFSFIIIVIPKRFLQQYSLKTRQVWETLFFNFQTVTSGTKELMLNQERQDYFLNQDYKPSLELHRDLSIREQTLRGVLTRISEYFLFIVLGVGVIFLSLNNFVSTSDFLFFLTTLLFMLGPLSAITNLFVNLPKTNVSIRHINQFIEHFKHPSEEPTSPITLEGQGLVLHQVCFSYFNHDEDRHFKLGPINATFRPGETTFIIGGNGSGKSTLGKLLCGLYLPQSGSISFGDKRLTAHSQKQFHQNFSAIFSDFYVFENILNTEDFNEKHRVTQYIEHLKLSHKISINEDSFSTTKLSQGQRKRLALVHALMEDRPCYILDEWASDQDPEFKKFFYNVIVPELKAQGKIVIVITHDDYYFHTADHLIYLSDGQLKTGA